jgi:hypothetical protein
MLDHVVIHVVTHVSSVCIKCKVNVQYTHIHTIFQFIHVKIETKSIIN